MLDLPQLSTLYIVLYQVVFANTNEYHMGIYRIGGREVAMAIRKTGSHDILTSFKLLSKDFSLAMIGLIISIAIAIGVNDQLTLSSMLETIQSEFILALKSFFLKF